MTNRQMFNIPLRPAVGSRFQPTGFPDIGNATFQRPVEGGGWQDALLVESAQSMANHLEGVGWDDATDQPVAVLEGLSYVRVLQDGDYLTSSRTESHRLASAFVKDSTLDGADMKTVIRERLGLPDKDRPLSNRDVAAGVFALDPMCLVHGVFFAEAASVWPGQPKIARAITAMVEAHDVRRAESGGVKRDHVRHSIEEGKGGSTEGYGSIPFHRTEWTARSIEAMVAIDLAQIRSYGLSDAATKLLTAIARWEVASLFDGGLRLRTMCDLELVDGSSLVDSEGGTLPSVDELASQITSLVPQCADELGEGGPIEVEWNGGGKKGAGR